jgi:hypothetical protein
MTQILCVGHLVRYTAAIFWIENFDELTPFYIDVTSDIINLSIGLINFIYSDSIINNLISQILENLVKVT